MKKTLSLLLAAAMTLSLLAGCGSKNNNDASQSAAGSGSASASQSQQGVEKTGVNFMALSGPTGVGAAYLMKYYSAETSPADCPVALNSTVAADNKEVTDALVNGTADIAAVATNVAANLAAKTDGGIQVLAVNTLGVLYILEKGDSVQSMTDLAGKTVYATGQGANPEYVLNYLLTQNGVDPSQVDIQWMTAQEVTAQMASGDSAICMLPVPAATALMMKDQGVRQALSLSDEWDKLGQGSLAMGCVVGRTQFIEEHPETVDAFLDLYGDSITFMSDEHGVAGAAALVGELGITANEQIAQKAIPQCNLTFLTGADMKATLEEYYQVLFQADPASIGGSMPYDAFYYGAE
ncbi:ABC transporter substrate-binding protein [Colidextribacter sp. 210702-DFI.3.9]|nr:ABC transporter substrate-binding protein [Colidextribacter sp. 210702-DFI.3.9]